MNQFNLGNFLNKFVNYSLSNFKGGGQPNLTNAPANPDVKFQLPSPETLAQNLLQKPITQAPILNTLNPTIFTDLKMNHLASLERGLYVKDLMNLPKEMEEMLAMVQNNMASTKEVAKLLSTNINLNQLVQLMQQGGKEAMNKLILTMASSSKQGMTDVSQIKDAMKLINASVSVAGQDNPSQILKSFMLLYLPWLPLQEGVDFDLEIESSEGSDGESETSITIMISTKNYGNVKIILVLFGTNYISIIVNCCEKFPKEELLKKIDAKGKSYSIQSNVTFEMTKIKEDKEAEGKESTPKEPSHQAKISMSSLTEINPFLLLMANAVIRYTIELDNKR